MYIHAKNISIGHVHYGRNMINLSRLTKE